MSGRIAGILLVSLYLAACTKDDTIHASNDEPTADITSHADGAHVEEGVAVELIGQASDRDDPAESLMVSWEVGGVEVCAPAAASADGRASCSTTFEPGEAQVSMLVRDPADAVSTDTITLVVDESGAPVVELLQPNADEGRFYANVPIDFHANVSDEEDGPEQLTAAWASDQDGDLDLSVTVQPSGEVKDTGKLSAGRHLITLKVTDTDDKTGSASVTVDVLPDNRPPVCAITEPETGSSGEAGQSVTIRGTATDPDLAPEELDLLLESDLSGVLTTEPPTTDGTVTYATSDLAQGTHKIRLTVTDDVGEICSHEVLYTVGQPPVVVITAPVDGALVNLGEFGAFTGTVADGDDPVSDLKIEWLSSLDGTLDTTAADSFGNVGFTSSELSRGTHEITLTATDPKGLYHRVKQDFVVNGLPGAPVVSLSPDPARTNDDLVVSIDTDSVDPESDPITYSYQWYRDGVVLGAATTPTLAAVDTRKGSTFKVVVTPDDGHGAGTSATAELKVSNTPPTVDSASLAPAMPATADDILCTGGVVADDDGDFVSLSYAWIVGERARRSSPRRFQPVRLPAVTTSPARSRPTMARSTEPPFAVARSP